jgi:ubiquitin-conjugating enzyme E2 H
VREIYFTPMTLKLNFNRSSPEQLSKYIFELAKKYPIENVVTNSDQSVTFNSYFFGPQNDDSPFYKQLFQVTITLTNDFPYKNPSIGVKPRTIYHPNICFKSGSVCVNALKTDWKPEYTLLDVIEVILPSMLVQMNVEDP